MKTDLLRTALNLAKPALGSGDGQPILSHFVFVGDAVFAFDDVTAIVVELQTGLECALHGDTLLGLLEAAQGDVEIKGGEGSAQLKLGGKSKAAIPSLPLDQSTFEWPEEKPEVSLPLGDVLRGALELALLSVGVDSIKPEFAGVAVDISPEGIVLYSTDNHTVSRIVVDVKFITRARMQRVIPAASVAALLKLPKGEHDKLQFCKTVTIAALEGVSLVARSIQAPVDVYRNVLKQHTTGGVQLDLPEGFDGEVIKASVVTARDGGKEMHIALDGNELHTWTQGSMGKVDGRQKLDKKFGPVEVIISPEHIQRVLPHVTKGRFNHGRSLVVDGPDFTHIITSAPVADAQAAPGKGKADDDIPF